MLRKFRMLVTGLGAAGALLLPVMAMAADEKPKLDTGDTAWMLTSTALVLMMTIPGLALFYGGMVRKKNVLATVMQSFAITCLVQMWILLPSMMAQPMGRRWSSPRSPVLASLPMVKTWANTSDLVIVPSTSEITIFAS